MSSSNEKFGTVINCMDGRAIRSVLEYFENTFGILYPDMVTDAGAVNCCDAGESSLENVRARVVGVSVNKHNSRHIAIVAHEECAGNPISKEEQIAQIERYVTIVKEWVSEHEDIKVFGLWCERQNGSWVTLPIENLVMQAVA